MGTVKSIEQAHALLEARKILNGSIRPPYVIWKRHVRYAWQSAFKRDVLVVLLPSLELRVTDYKTGEVIVQGPAWVDTDKSSDSR